MIEIRHASYTYEGSDVFRDLSFELRPGEIVALMGPNASGKSTLAKILNGLLIPEGGECIVDGVSTQSDPFHARLRVGLVFQDPDDQAVSRRVEDDIAFGPLNLEAPDIDTRVAQAMHTVGIEHLAGRDIQTLSGGQKQLVAIAGVLAMNPAYVVMDEPTSFLDQDGARAVLEAVATMGKAGKGVLIITHDPTVAATADRILVLRAGQISLFGAADLNREDTELPELARFWKRLAELGVTVDRMDLDVERAMEALCRLRWKA